ncbi:MAG: rhomboid family intramembrane serine protease [Acidobacteria bacterium]|nr:rhomboid family intramembrane serine protease [Acidobacteriota bacterium]
MSFTYQTEDAESEISEEQDHEPVETPTPPYYTLILVGAIVVVALVQFSTGLEASIHAAGFDKRSFLDGHQYWLILTGAATHGSAAHILMNAYAFYSFGKIFEMLSNKAHLAAVCLLSAVGGGLLSLIFTPNGVSVGASGGIVGLIGYLAVYAFRRRQFITPEFRKNLLFNIGFILVFGLVLYDVIDNFGHIGGLITGAIYALFQVPTDPHADPRKAGSAAEIAGFASLAVYIASCGFAILLILHIV